MTTISRSATALVGAATLALTLSACGSSGDDSDKAGVKDTSAAEKFAKESGKDIIDEAMKAMKGLTSMRFQGTVPGGDSGPVELDLAVDRDGNCAGTVAAEGGEAQIIVDGTDQYLKGDEQYWIASLDETRGPSIHNLIGDRWVKLPKEGADFSSFCDLDSFLEEFDGDDAPTDKGEVDEVNGEQAVSVTEEEDGGTTKAWVATSEPHYVLKIENDGDEAGEINFSDFDEPVDAQAPDPEDIADLESLGG